MFWPTNTDEPHTLWEGQDCHGHREALTLGQHLILTPKSEGMSPAAAEEVHAALEDDTLPSQPHASNQQPAALMMKADSAIPTSRQACVHRIGMFSLQCAPLTVVCATMWVVPQGRSCSEKAAS